MTAFATFFLFLLFLFGVPLGVSSLILLTNKGPKSTAVKKLLKEIWNNLKELFINLWGNLKKLFGNLLKLYSAIEELVNELTGKAEEIPDIEVVDEQSERLKEEDDGFTYRSL